ncbi:unnamed protein product [Orchesella dallaii]
MAISVQGLMKLQKHKFTFFTGAMRNSVSARNWKRKRLSPLHCLLPLECLLLVVIVTNVIASGEVVETVTVESDYETEPSSPPSSSSSSSETSGVAGNVYRGQSVQSVLSSFDGVHQLYPTVNKCCPFFSRYESGECVQAQKNSSRMVRTQREPYWEAPKTMVTLGLVGRDLDGMEISNDTVVFRLRVSQPACASERIERIIKHDIQPRNYNQDVNGTSTSGFEPAVILTIDGSLAWADEAGVLNQVSDQDFCIDIVEENVFVAVICMPECNEKQPCIRKCCRQDSVLFNSTCMPSNRPWIPRLYSTPNGSPLSASEVAGLKISYKIGHPCEDAYAVSLRDEPDEKMYLLLNGTLVLDSGNSKVFIEPDKYCLDGAGSHTILISDNNPEYPEPFEIVHYGGTEIDQVVHICFSGDNVPEDNTKYDVWQLRLYASVNLVSTFFLLLTAIVYVILWEHQNIHGWLQYSYVISLLCANIFLSVVQFAPHSLQIECLVCCRIMGSLIHFSYLSAFFWLTSMNFDLFWTFSGCRPLRTSTNTGEKKRYLGFLLFSLGFPTLIAGAGLVLDSLFKDDPQLFVITPRFGERNCYFYGEKEKLPYFYGPVGLLLTINSIFFVCTIYSLHKLQNDTKFATRQSSRQEKQR